MFVAVCGRRCSPRGRRPRAARRSRGPRQQVPQADQVVGRRGEGHDPIDELSAAVPELPQATDGLHPAEDLLDQLPLLLTDGVTGLPGGAAVDRTAFRLLGDVRRDTEGADLGDKTADVEALIATDGL